MNYTLFFIVMLTVILDMFILIKKYLIAQKNIALLMKTDNLDDII